MTSVRDLYISAGLVLGIIILTVVLAWHYRQVPQEQTPPAPVAGRQ